MVRRRVVVARRRVVVARRRVVPVVLRLVAGLRFVVVVRRFVVVLRFLVTPENKPHMVPLCREKKPGVVLNQYSLQHWECASRKCTTSG